jgi:hypothetical protein
MFRETMINVIPVAMMEIDTDWTARFTMLTGSRNRPLVLMPKPMRMTARASTIPKTRKSISIARRRLPRRRPLNLGGATFKPQRPESTIRFLV